MKETLNFVNYPEKQQTVRKQMLEDCTTFVYLTLCLNNLLTETEQSSKNLLFHLGVIDKILQCSNSEQPVLDRKKCRNIFIKIVLLPQVRQVL